MIDRLRRALLVAGGTTLGAGALPALAAAPAIRGPRAGRDVPLLATYVAAAGYYGAAQVADRLRPGDGLELRRAPENAYDRRAVEVWDARHGVKLGYVPRIDNQALANLMDAGLRPRAVVRSVATNGARPEIRLDIGLSLPA